MACGFECFERLMAQLASSFSLKKHDDMMDFFDGKKWLKLS